MKCSFSIENNDICGGESMMLSVEGFSAPETVMGKKCCIKLYEIDTLVGKKRETTDNDLLAVFETEIVKKTNKNIYYFDSAKTQRADTFERKIPKSGSVLDKDGNPLSFTQPYFEFALDFGGVRPSAYDYSIVVIRSEKSELEMYIYEIGFTVEIDGVIIYDACKIPAYVDCMNLLLQNCANAAKILKINHDNAIKDRSVGTHFGDHYIYSCKNERAYLEMVSQYYNGCIDETWIQQMIGKEWENEKKIEFDKNKTTFGLQPTSCIDYVLSTMVLGFKKTNMENEWKRIVAYVKNGMGQWLAKGLTDNGWVALYYNPDVNHPEDDNDEHIQSYLIARKSKQYGSDKWPPVVPVFDFIINYRPTHLPATGRFENAPLTTVTAYERDQVALLKKIPFAFLMSRGGIHTALLCNGFVYEVHWDVGPEPEGLFTDSIEFDAKWEWNSGLIIVPRSYWPVARSST